MVPLNHDAWPPTANRKVFFISIVCFCLNCDNPNVVVVTVGCWNGIKNCWMTSAWVIIDIQQEQCLTLLTPTLPSPSNQFYCIVNLPSLVLWCCQLDSCWLGTQQQELSWVSLLLASTKKQLTATTTTQVSSSFFCWHGASLGWMQLVTSWTLYLTEQQQSLTHEKLLVPYCMRAHPVTLNRTMLSTWLPGKVVVCRSTEPTSVCQRLSCSGEKKKTW